MLLAWAGTAYAGEPAPGPRPIGVPDPMDVVRERLAQRLGVIKPSENPNVVRVVSKPSAPSAEASAPRRADAPAKPLVHRTPAKPADKRVAEHAEHLQLVALRGAVPRDRPAIRREGESGALHRRLLRRVPEHAHVVPALAEREADLHHRRRVAAAIPRHQQDPSHRSQSSLPTSRLIRVFMRSSVRARLWPASRRRSFQV